MKDIPDIVCWFEGMQLLPQHFQMQTLRSESIAAILAGAAQPYYWGVLDFKIDEAALMDGQVRISALDVIFPDGTPVSYDISKNWALCCDVSKAVAEAPKRTVTVYLVLPPLWRAGRLDTRAKRYISQIGEAMPDLSSGENPASLTLWRHDIRIVPDSERADLICVPLLRVAMQGGGFVRQPYEPPSPRILPEGLLGRKITLLCAKVREKCLFLGGRLHNAKEANNKDDVQEISRQLSALWARLPEIEAALGSRSASPAMLYTALAGMAGSLCTLDLSTGVPVFEAFNYLELLTCFDTLIVWLLTQLEGLRADYQSHIFSRDNSGFWIEVPAGEENAKQLIIGLRMPNGMAKSAANDWLNKAIIASESQVSILVRQRMRGMAYRPLSRTEQAACSVGDDTHLFALEVNKDWFKPWQKLMITLPTGDSEREPWEILLFVKSSTLLVPNIEGEDHD